MKVVNRVVLKHEPITHMSEAVGGGVPPPVSAAPGLAEPAAFARFKETKSGTRHTLSVPSKVSVQANCFHAY